MTEKVFSEQVEGYARAGIMGTAREAHKLVLGQLCAENEARYEELLQQALMKLVEETEKPAFIARYKEEAGTDDEAILVARLLGQTRAQFVERAEQIATEMARLFREMIPQIVSTSIDHAKFEAEEFQYLLANVLPDNHVHKHGHLSGSASGHGPAPRH